ncbi:hypothetical protein GCM10023235_25530 [Kitasatospora terrestris]|uniref:Uncharacterized protein n=1 Tax=Kitasatospora terrestris TaxID=258051 RepID=A0ABP9DJ45_9ACTN
MPQDTSTSSRSAGYPEPPSLQRCLVYSVRFAGLSGTAIVVPSIAQTSSPPPPCPGGADSGGRAAQQVEQPAQRLGANPLAGLSQGAAGRVRDRQTVQAGRQPLPHLPPAPPREQGPGQQRVHHHSRRQVPDPGLHSAGLRQRLVDHLERHDPGQLAEMAGRERPCGNHNLARDDRLSPNPPGCD